MVQITGQSIKSSGVSLHFEKHKANDTAVNGLQRHNERVPGQKHSNEKIDDTRTADNIFLKKSDDRFNKTVSDVIENERDKGLKGVRKDAVRMVEATVQLSGKVLDMDENEQEQVLRDSYEWLKSEFGENNIVSAVIHKDETNMHLHFDFVPIRDRKLNAKAVISKLELKRYQNEFLSDLQDKHPTLNFERGGGETNGLSQRDFEILQKEREAREKELSEYSDKLDSYENELIERDDKLEARETHLKARESVLDKRESELNEREKNLSEGTVLFNKSVSEFKSEKQEFNKSVIKVQELNADREISLNGREKSINIKDKQADEKLNEAKRLTDKWERAKLEVESMMKRVEAKLKGFGSTWERILNGVRTNQIKQDDVIKTVEKHNPVETETDVNELLCDLESFAENNELKMKMSGILDKAKGTEINF